MLNLSVITWRLGRVNAQQFEYLIQQLSQQNQYNLNLDDSYNDIFFLTTCQRIVLVATNPKTQFRQFYLKWTEANDLDPAIIPEPEIYHGMEALYHLGSVVSALDSLVIGEEQIQGQFKDAYTHANEYMSTYLDTIIQKLLRTGKQVRKRSLLEQGQISTISVVSNFLSEHLEAASTIAIVGTGKMAKGIINYFGENYPDIDITLFSRTEERIGQHVIDKPIVEFDELNQFDLIFTATKHQGIIDDKLVTEKQLQDVIFVDLGMPRNCNISLPEVKLWTLEQIIRKVQREEQSPIILSAYKVLDDQLEQVKLDLLKQQHSDKIKRLRMDMLNAANLRKEEILDSTNQADKKIDQLVNTLIHISQKHLEDYMLVENSS